MINIAIIAPSKLPIPSILGGAIETLTTQFIDENENYNNIHFVVFNQSKPIAIEKKYSNCEFRFFKETLFSKLIDRFYIFICKLFRHRTAFNSSYLAKTCRAIKKEGFDGVLIEGMPNYAWRIYKNTRIKPTLHLHTDLLYDKSRNAKEIVDSCSKIICVSDYIRRRVLTITPKIDNKIKVVLNCVDINEFNPVVYNKNRSVSRKMFGYNENDFVVAFSGRINEMKGVDDLVAAFLELNISNKKLLLVGGSNFADSKLTPFVSSIAELITQYPDDIKMTGFIEHSKVPFILSACDVYVSPSKYYEAAPLANLEAMCLGLPCVVSNRGGIKEYINTNCIVIDVDSNRVNNIRTAIMTVYHNRRVKTTNELKYWGVARFYLELSKLLME